MRRVVVTGMGTLSPLGLTVDETWKNCLEGKSGIAPITLFDTTDCPVLFAGEVKGFDAGARFTVKEAGKMGRFNHLGLAAGIDAFQDSGLESIRGSLDFDRIGVNIGVGMGGLPEIEATYDSLLKKGYRRISPFFIPQSIPNMPSGHVSMQLGITGPNFATASACATSAHSIGESVRAIQYGHVDVMIAGGAEAVVCKLGIGGFAACRALSSRNEAPEKASRPYDTDRDGFVLGEGAAVLVLEEYEMAKNRGAKIYGEIVGYGFSSDAYHMTNPSPGGAGGLKAMRMAVKEAGITPQVIDYINSHGTSTPLGDLEEGRAIRSLMEGETEHLHVSSTKSMTGHLLGAAGALESIFSLLAIRDQVVPPTINLDSIDPECEELGLCFTPHRKVEKPIRFSLSNSFGFGGTNASLLFAKI